MYSVKDLVASSGEVADCNILSTPPPSSPTLPFPKTYDKLQVCKGPVAAVVLVVVVFQKNVIFYDSIE